MTPFASVFISATALFLACSANHDPYGKWTLTGYDFNQSSFTIQPYVSNGYIGQRLPVTGFGYSEIQPLGPQNGTNGWPLFDNRFTAAMVAGFYDQQPNTTGTNFRQTGGVSLSPSSSCTVQMLTSSLRQDNSQFRPSRHGLPCISRSMVSRSCQTSLQNSSATSANLCPFKTALSRHLFSGSQRVPLQTLFPLSILLSRTARDRTLASFASKSTT